jgi:hypothetical protein
MATEGTALAGWKQQYQSVLLETDSAKLPGRVADAQAAIRDRMQALSSNRACDERLALEYALRVLHILEKVTSEPAGRWSRRWR